MLTFGGKLCKHNPLEFCEIYENKESYEAGFPPKNVASFHFETSRMPYKNLTDAYDDELAEDKFFRTLQGLDEPKKQLILAAHSFAVARACREALDHRDFLVKLVKSVPERAKYEIVKGNGAAVVKFGKYAKEELKDEFLNKL